jgi:integrator complex subunit 7
MYQFCHMQHSFFPLRGVTLRLLGEMARIMPRRTSVHHAIRCALDSHDKVEMEAAIVAAGSFAKESKTFASSIFAKLTAMIDGLVTPADMKLKLIPIFQAMHHDNQLSVSVRSFLSGSPHPSSHRVSRSSFLGSNPSQRFVLVVLDTLTNLAAESVVDIPEQVELLIRYLRTDPRTSVKKCALQGLKTLADGNPHRWNQDSLGALLDFIMVLIESTNSNRIERSGRQSTNKR